MLYRILLLSLFVSFGAKAEESKRIAIGFMKFDSQKDESISKREAVYHFSIQRIDKAVMNSEISYSIDGESLKTKLEEGQFEVRTSPGKHKFQVYINSNYYELYSDSLNILGGYKDSYYVYPQWAEIEVISDKPVIYLYPERKTNVKVEVKPAGKFLFTYPRYENGWNVVAHEDGTITHDDEDYNYLFWEGSQKTNVGHINFKSGYITDGSDITPFLEDILAQAKFTASERADFITYWAPRMMNYDKMFIQFVQGKSCDQFATLSITPTPDHINRFYMIWMPIDEAFKIGPQEIEPINRDGFTAFEWGGQQLMK